MTPLYWDFIDRNREVYQKGRSPYALAQLSRLDMDAIRQQKDYFLQKYRANAE